MKFVLVIVLISTVLGSDEVAEENESNKFVIELTEQNFGDFIGSNDYVFVEFYAVGCGACKQLAPHYNSAAKILADAGSPIKLAKINAITETDIANKYNVDGYPTLLLFRKGDVTEYNRDRSAEDIVRWLNKKIAPPATELNDIEEVRRFLEDNDVVSIGFFTDQSSGRAKLFLKVADNIDDFPMGITSNERIFKEYSAKNEDIILFKKHDDEKVRYEGELNEENLEVFFSARSLPSLVELTQETTVAIIRSKITTILFFILSKSDENAKEIEEEARSIATHFQEKLRFVLVNTDVEGNSGMLQYLRIERRREPFMVIFELQKFNKYKPEHNEITAASIRKFVEDFLDNKIEKYLSSQDLPEDWNKGAVYTLVGTNFYSVAFDVKKDVLVEFYAPWCNVCKNLAPIYEEVGEHFKNTDDVIIAKIDITANELSFPTVNGVPMIVLYRKGENEDFEYGGPHTLEGIIKFVKSGGIEGRRDVQETEEEKGDVDEESSSFKEEL